VNEKKCSKCGEIFPATTEYFYRQKDKKGNPGLHWQCKTCRKNYAKEWYHRPEVRKQQIENTKRWSKENEEHVKEYRKKYHEENREHLNEQSKKYYHENKDMMREKFRNWQKENREHLNKYRKERYWSDPEKARRVAKIAADNYKEKMSAGIYKIINTKTDTAYIGQSVIVKIRMSDHRSRLRGKKHVNPQIQEDWDKYGEEAFIFKVIEELPCDTPPDVLLEKECEQIKKHLKEGKEIYNKEGG